MARYCAIPFSHQEDRYMLQNTLLTVSVFVATAACGQSQTPAAPAAPPAAGAAGKLYTVVEGYKVDAETMKGFRAWRAAACDRCHGANQEGMVGPSLIASMKTLTKDEFVKVVRDGRLEKGMQSFGTSPQVMENMNQLYAYLKGRSDGAITRAKVEPMP
jgi:mono/diheme cytochrome c family protein